jgi:hypothetical protein
MTNKQRIFLITISIIALVIVALLFRQCANRQADVEAITSDTTVTVTPGVVVTPPIFEPEPDFAGLDSLSDLLRHFKGRYAAYKEKSGKYEKVIDELTKAVEGAGTCEEARAILDVQVAALAMAADECNAALASLQTDAENAATAHSYTGEEVTDAYKIGWRINTVGTLPDGGFSYVVDAYGREIETTKTEQVDRWKKHRVSALLGLQSGKDFRRVYGAQYQRSGKTFGVTAQGGYLPGVDGYGVTWQALGGIGLSF